MLLGRSLAIVGAHANMDLRLQDNHSSNPHYTPPDNNGRHVRRRSCNRRAYKKDGQMAEIDPA